MQILTIIFKVIFILLTTGFIVHELAGVVRAPERLKMVKLSNGLNDLDAVEKQQLTTYLFKNDKEFVHYFLFNTLYWIYILMLLLVSPIVGILLILMSFLSSMAYKYDAYNERYIMIDAAITASVLLLLLVDTIGQVI